MRKATISVKLANSIQWRNDVADAEIAMSRRNSAVAASVKIRVQAVRRISKEIEEGRVIGERKERRAEAAAATVIRPDFGNRPLPLRAGLRHRCRRVSRL